MIWGKGSVGSRIEWKHKEDVYNSLEQVRCFLAHVWGLYTPGKDTWCEIRVIRPDGRAKSYWFRWGPGIDRGVVEWLKEGWNRLKLYSANVNLGILPRSNFSQEELNKNGVPKKGSKAHNVKGGLFIFADLDYKQEVDPNSLSDEIRQALERQGYYVVKETEDGGLEGYFKRCNKDTCKIEYVKKPGFNEFLDNLSIYTPSQPNQ